MLDFQDSPTLPRFAFGPYDEVIMNGISYSVDDSDDFGFMFIRTDGSKLSESFTHQELSRRVRLGILEHRRDAFLPETAKRRLKNPSQEISTLPVKQQQKAKYHESLVRAFLEMEADGKVNRTEASVTAALPEIKFRAGRFLVDPERRRRGRGRRQQDDRAHQDQCGQVAQARCGLQPRWHVGPLRSQREREPHPPHRA